MTSSSELVITRTLDATPEAVFKAWSDPSEMLKWGGPKDYPMASTEGEVRPGGKWKATLRSPDGEELKQSGVWRDLRAPKHLALTFGWDNRDEPRKETLIDIDLEPQANGRTRMTFRQGPFDSVENREGHREGWNSAFDRLEGYLH
jgi:uncharacterized protein YndB with AHSA1/START domain